MTLSKEEKRWLMWGSLAILVAIAIWLWNRAQATASPVTGTPPQSVAPTQYATTPGIPDIGVVYYGQPSPFDTTANLNINSNVPGYISNGYLPLFGFVGFGVGPGIN